MAGQLASNEGRLKVLCAKGRSRLIRVSSLIDAHGEWDETLIRKTFFFVLMLRLSF
jgi:hypothetical protein